MGCRAPVGPTQRKHVGGDSGGAATPWPGVQRPTTMTPRSSDPLGAGAAARMLAFTSTTNLRSATGANSVMTDQSQAVTSDCALQATSISGRLEGLLAEISVEQTYDTIGTSSVESVLAFPLPVGAVLLDVQIQNGARVLQSQVRPTQIEAVDVDVASIPEHLIQDTADRAMYSVCLNLLPGQTSLIYRYALLAQWNGDALWLHLPTRVTPPDDQPLQVSPISVSLDLALGGALREARVASPHPIRLHEEGDVLHVRLGSESILLTDDTIALKIRVPRAASGVYAPDRDGWVMLGNFQADWTEDSEQAGRDIVLVGEDSALATNDALLAVLERFSPQDRFNIVRFATEARSLFSGLETVEDDTLARARDWIKTSRYRLTGNKARKGLALADQQRQDRPLDILLIVKEDLWDTKQLVETARLSGNRVFPIGVNNTSLEDTLRALADATGGAAAFVLNGAAMIDGVRQHFERLRAPRAMVSFSLPVAPLWAIADVTDCYRGETLQVLAGLPERPTKSVTLRLTPESGAASTLQTLTLHPWPVAATDSLPRIAAACRLQRLPHDEAASLAMTYELLTPYTDFVMVDSQRMDQRDGTVPEIRVVPHFLGFRFQVIVCNEPRNCCAVDVNRSHWGPHHPSVFPERPQEETRRVECLKGEPIAVFATPCEDATDSNDDLADSQDWISKVFGPRRTPRRDATDANEVLELPDWL